MAVLQYFGIILGILNFVATASYRIEESRNIPDLKARRMGENVTTVASTVTTESINVTSSPISNVTQRMMIVPEGEDKDNILGRQNADITTYGYEIWCRLQYIDYDCTGKGNGQNRYSFDMKLGQCVYTRVSNCENNLNVFRDNKSCMKFCTAITHQAINIADPGIRCRLQPDFGDCQKYVPSFYYDVNERTCRGFSYSGCCGNNNRFSTKQECEDACLDAIDYTKTGTK